MSTDNGFFLEPIGRRMIVKPDGDNYKGKIIIPEKYKGKATTGTILAMGETHEKMRVGDRIVYDVFSGGELGFQISPEEGDLHLRYLSFDEAIAIVTNPDAKIKA